MRRLTRSSAFRIRAPRARRPWRSRRRVLRPASGRRRRRRRPRRCARPRAPVPWPRPRRCRRRSGTAPRGSSPPAPAGATRRRRGRSRRGRAAPAVRQVEEVTADERHADLVPVRPGVVVRGLRDLHLAGLVERDVTAGHPVEQRTGLVVVIRDEAVHRHAAVHDHLAHGRCLLDSGSAHADGSAAAGLVGNQSAGSGPTSSAWPGCSRRNRRRTSRYPLGVSPVNSRNSWPKWAWS